MVCLCFLKHPPSKPQLQLILKATTTLVLPWPTTYITISVSPYLRPTVTTFTTSKDYADPSGYCPLLLQCQ
jgi:hypothetical protein